MLDPLSNHFVARRNMTNQRRRLLQFQPKLLQPKHLLQPVLSAPTPKNAPKGPPKSAKGKSKGKPGKPMTVEEKAKTPCIFHQMPNGCVHGDKCHYSHVKAPPAKLKDSKADPKAKPKPATPKVAAAVAIVAALSLLCHSIPSHWRT